MTNSSLSPWSILPILVLLGTGASAQVDTDRSAPALQAQAASQASQPPELPQNPQNPQNLGAGDLAGALGIFGELGLPHSKGAKWVRAYVESGNNHDQELPTSGQKQYTGNAWLLRESSDGTVELLVEQCRRVTGRLVDREGRNSGGKKDSLPRVQLTPANLDTDIALLTEALNAARNPARAENDYEIEQTQKKTGIVLLFAAHLQEQGRKGAAENLVSGALAVSVSPKAAVDAAVCEIADGQCDELAQRWIKTGDTKAYITAIKKLQDTFPRGWVGWGAAGLLIERLQNPIPGALANDPTAIKAAAFLQALTPDDARAISQRGNWLNPANAGAFGSAQEVEYPDDGEPKDSSAGAPDPAKSNSRLSMLANNPRDLANGLARLLGDHRLLRIPNRNFDGSSYVRESETAKEKLDRTYTNLRRPTEVGELAGELLSRILPQHLSYRHQEEGARGAVLDWIQTMTRMDDEQLAWALLREAALGRNASMAQSMIYLIKNGGAASQEQLREVFLDPALWGNNSGNQLIPMLEAYIKRNGTDPVFAQKLSETVKAGGQLNESQAAEGNSPAQLKQQQQQQDSALAQQLKLIENALHPRSLKELMAELIASKGPEANALLQVVIPQLLKEPQPVAKLFQAAATIQDTKSKGAMLGAILRLANRSADQAAPFPGPIDPETAQAVKVLLQDQSPPGADYLGGTIADLAGFGLICTRSPVAEASSIYRISWTDSQLWSKLIHARAQALVNNQAVPAMPDASSVGADRIASMIADLAALPSDKILESIRAKSPSEQMAVYAHLKTLKPWPGAFAKARLTITEVKETKGGVGTGLNFGRLKGHELDAAVKQEIETELEKSADGKVAANVTITGIGALGGLKLTVASNVDSDPRDETNGNPFEGQVSVSMEQLVRMGGADIPKDPPPIAVILYNAANRENQTQEAGRPVLTPIWSDAAKTKAWHEKQANMAADPKAKKAPKPVPDLIEKARAEPQSWFEFHWALLPIQDDSVTPSTEEP